MTSYSWYYKLGITTAVNIYCSSELRILCGREWKSFFLTWQQQTQTHTLVYGIRRMRSKQLSKQACYCCLSGKVIFFMTVQDFDMPNSTAAR
jgi:hypothetical protein